VENETPHGRLIGLPDEDLRALAPEATHQHRKGGLYRDLGIALNANDHSALADARGYALRGWLHIHPHAVQLLMRPVDEDDKFRALA